MADDYTGAKPNPDWWMQQIYAGIDFRRRCAYEQDWSRWRNYYRGSWRGDVMPHNIFFAMMRTIVPRVYFRNPSISISPDIPGPEGIAIAQLLERVDNKMMVSMGMKKQLKRVVQYAFQFGTSGSKLGFGAQFTPTPEFGGTAAPLAKGDRRVEYRDNVFPNMPWFSALHPKDLIFPHGTVHKEEARWIGYWVRRPREDVLRDKRLKNTAGIGTRRVKYQPYQYSTIFKEVEMVDMVQIHDKARRTVMVIAPDGDRSEGRELYSGPDELQAYGSIPLYSTVFNEDDEWVWGTPDSKILEPYQLEINEIKTQIMKHRRLSLVKILAQKGGITEEQAQLLLDENAPAVLRIDGDPRADILPMQVSQIPQDLIQAAGLTEQDVRAIIGFSRNEFGEFNSQTSDTTAFEASVVQAAANIRVDERRDEIADLIVDVISDMHIILFNHWSEQQVMEVVGPGGVPVWVSFSGAQLGTYGPRFKVKVDPDSSSPETKQLREAKAMRTYELLSQNPLIDPMKLTQYLLHELHGVQFDDMMRMLPPPPEMPGGPVGLDQYTQMIQGSIGQMGANGGPNNVVPFKGKGAA